MWNTLTVVVLVSLFAVGFSEICYFDLNFVNGSTVTPCVQMNISSTIGIRYLTDENKIGYTSMMIPCNSTHPSTSSGICNGTGASTKNASLSIMWHSSNETDTPSNNLTFYFEKDGKEWSITNMSLVVDVGEIDDRKSTADTVTGRIDENIFGKVQNSRAYYCKSNRTVTIANADQKDFNISMALMDFKVQAFGFKANGTANGYGQVSRCSQDIKGSKIVPIAVGAALAGLVVIVLIAYIIGRLRSRRQSSYEALS